MKLTEQELKAIADSVKSYLDGKGLYIVRNERFDSVTDGDIGYSFYREEKRFHGNLKVSGTFRDKGHFEGTATETYIKVSEQSNFNSYTLPL